MSKIIIICAICKKNNVIGKNGKIPWHISEEYKNFKNLTNNHIVIFGKNTYFSLPEKYRPLPNRVNLIITQDENLLVENENLKVFKSLSKAIEFSTKTLKEKNIFLCGGSRIYKEGLNLCDYMYLSFIKKEYGGDIFFPKFDKTKFQQITREDFEDFEFIKFKKVQKMYKKKK